MYLPSFAQSEVTGLAKHKKKKNAKSAGKTNIQQNIKKKNQRKMSENAVNNESIKKIKNKEKSLRKEAVAAVAEKTEVIKAEVIEEIAAIRDAAKEGKKENTETKHLSGERFLSFAKCREAAARQWDKFSKFIMETKKVSIPVIIIIYTVVIASAAFIIDNFYNKRQLEMEEMRLIEEMANARAHSADIILEKDEPFAAGDESVVTYGGYLFTDRVAAQNAEKYSACYENTAENNTYLDVMINYENTGESSIRADMACVMTVNDGTRDYPCFSAAETDGGKNIEFASGQTIEPGAAVRIHFIFDVPKELERSEGAISAKVIIDNVGYVINIRE